MSTPLKQLLADILFDDAARTAFGADSENFLEEHGWSNLEGTEIEEAVAALSDGLPVETAQAIGSAVEAVDFSSESLGEVGAELAAATADLSFDESALLTEPATEASLEFGAGAQANSPVDDVQVGHEAEIDHTTELGSTEILDTETDELTFDGADQGIDIDEPLVHDVEDADTAEVNFDLEPEGIDDLDI